MSACLARQIEQWAKFWETVTDPAEVERLKKLRWLEEFAFHSGPAISAEQYAALQQQIQVGEAKLSELCGDAAKTPVSARSQPVDSASPDLAENATAERTDFAAEEVPA